MASVSFPCSFGQMCRGGPSGFFFLFLVWPDRQERGRVIFRLLVILCAVVHFKLYRDDPFFFCDNLARKLPVTNVSKH